MLSRSSAINTRIVPIVRVCGVSGRCPISRVMYVVLVRSFRYIALPGSLSLGTVDHVREPGTLFAAMLENIAAPATEGRKSCPIRLRRNISNSLAILPNLCRVPRIAIIPARISTRHSPSNFSTSTRHSVTSRIRLNSSFSNHLIFPTRHLFRTLVTRHSTLENCPQIPLDIINTTWHFAHVRYLPRAFQKFQEILDTPHQGGPHRSRRTHQQCIPTVSLHASTCL